MLERLDFAPLDGITRLVYRTVWARRFGGADRYFIPFFSPTPQHRMTPRDLREVSYERNRHLPCVPQVMTRRAEDLIWAAEVLGDMGYTEVNLNLGCPSGTVTAKGKGAGFLAEPEELDRFFEAVFSKVSLPVSVKTRLGIRDPDEFERILEVYNRYPIACVTVHARVQKEKYRGPVHWDAFALALERSRNPLCYNGDVRTTAEADDFSRRFPAARAVMIGRGAVADPALFRKLRGGAAASREELGSFLAELYDAYTEAYQGQRANAAQRMREVWFYLIHLFGEAEKLNKRMRRFRTPAEYEAIQSEILARLPLRDHSEGELI